MLVWVLLEGVTDKSQGASIHLEEGLWDSPQGGRERGEGKRLHGRMLEALRAKDGSGMQEEPSGPICIRVSPTAFRKRPTLVSLL